MEESRWDILTVNRFTKPVSGRKSCDSLTDYKTQNGFRNTFQTPQFERGVFRASLINYDSQCEVSIVKETILGANH